MTSRAAILSLLGESATSLKDMSAASNTLEQFNKEFPNGIFGSEESGGLE